METIVYVAVVFIVIWNAILWWAQQKLNREIAEEELLEELQRRVPVGLCIEEINGVVYGWNHKTMDFVCQGADMAEFRSNFRARYPNRNAAIIDGPDELLQRFRVELKTLLQNENLNSQ